MRDISTRLESNRWLPLLLATAWVAGIGPGAEAGPPGVLDDPHVIGERKVEFIAATAAASQGGETGLLGPVFDLTVGLAEGLDLVLVGEAFHVLEGGSASAESGGFVGGFKWQPVAGRDWNAAWTPVFIMEIDGGRRVAVSNAFQAERSLGRYALGVDASYTWIDDGSDLVRAGVYGLLSASNDLTLLAEVFFENSPEAFDVTLGLGTVTSERRASDIAFNLGFDWEAAPRFHVLASAGTGIASHHRERIDWQGYFGLQWVWSPGEGPGD